MRGLVLISENVHDIPQRICEIDARYMVYYNKIKSRYEIHARGHSPSLQLVLPYRQLDIRSVDYVNMTRVDRQLDNIGNIDAENEQIMSEKVNAILDKMQYKTKSLMSYISSGGEDIPAYEEL